MFEFLVEWFHWLLQDTQNMAMVKMIADTHGRLDICVNSVGDSNGWFCCRYVVASHPFKKRVDGSPRLFSCRRIINTQTWVVPTFVDEEIRDSSYFHGFHQLVKQCELQYANLTWFIRSIESEKNFPKWIKVTWILQTICFITPLWKALCTRTHRR